MTLTKHGVTIRRCSMDKILKASELLERHRAEVSTEPGEPIALNEERYRDLEAVGGIISIGMFDGRKLVGYSVNIVGRHMNYDLVVCANSLLYVAPEHRRKGIGTALMAATRQEALSRGCHRLMWSAAPETTLESLLYAKGEVMREHSVTFTENLKGV